MYRDYFIFLKTKKYINIKLPDPLERKEEEDHNEKTKEEDGAPRKDAELWVSLNVHNGPSLLND